MSLPELSWDGGEWVLRHDWSAQVNGCVVTVPAGFRFDLSSIPRPLRVVVDSAGLGVRAPLVHDFIYRTRGIMGDGAVVPPKRFSRFEADRFFLLLMKEAGIGRAKRWLAWFGVRAGGWLPWPPRRTQVLDVLMRSFHTLWQTGVAVWLFDGPAIMLVAAGLAFVKASVWPWLRDTVRSVTY